MKNVPIPLWLAVRGSGCLTMVAVYQFRRKAACFIHRYLDKYEVMLDWVA